MMNPFCPSGPPPDQGMVPVEVAVAQADVVIVGAGPAGSAAAAWAAKAGRDVLVVDAAEFPRDKACGDGLTPRAVAELRLLGLGDWLDSHIKHRGRSEEHTSELQSHVNLVCRLLLEKKN